MEWNPILVRETRARFRHSAAFWLLFGYTVLLAGFIGWMYDESLGEFLALKNPLMRMPAIGHRLFFAFCCIQALVWALITPAIMASCIAREREDGLLESLHLSPLPPSRIVGGKLLSGLSFIGLLILISLPVESICLLMGGVSPGELRAAFALHVATAFFGACVGLVCSAMSRRANIALRSAYVVSIGWLIGSGLCWNSNYQIFAWTNPISAAWAITEAHGGASSAPTFAPFDTYPWLISLLFQVMVGAILLYISARVLRRPLEARDEANLHRLQQTATLTPATTSEESSKQAAPRGDWFDIPVAARLKFTNPVLQREARGKFRLKIPPLWVLLFEILLALPVAYYYLMTLLAVWTEKTYRENTWWIISFIALIVIAMSSAIMGAGAISREREGSTWQALRLSLVTPREVVWAKVGAILLSFVIYSIPFWPLLLPCVMASFVPGQEARGDLHPVQVASTVAILSATAVAYTLWGMWWSMRCRRTSAAIGWTLGSLFLILFIAPIFLFVGMSSSGGKDENLILFAFHPVVSLGMVVDGEMPYIGLICPGILLAISTFFLVRVIEEVAVERNL